MYWPPNIYYTPSDDHGIAFIVQHVRYRIDNGTALEMLYRINVGGSSVSSTEDIRMFRSWRPDDKYLTQDKTSVVLVNTSIELSFTKIASYTAPKDVYQTAKTMGKNKAITKSYNLTWEFPVDSQFYYVVRLFF
jgi:hypothetical protein